MPLIIEDGTIVIGANCYVTVAEADLAAVNVNDTAWMALAIADKEKFIIKGALIVDDGGTYVYSGSRTSDDQFMNWPRLGAFYTGGSPLVPPNTVPINIQRANIAAALGQNNGTISSGSTGPANRYVTQEKVGDLSVSYGLDTSGGTTTGSGSGPYSGLGFPAVTALVAPLLDAAFYSAQAADAGVASSVAAVRGPNMIAPSYGGLWDVGMNDYPGAASPAYPQIPE